jgi:type I restriction enzyme R subunit
MASGGGKTYTACNVAYRLVKYAGARRVLFLVDRANLGRQALKEFQAFITPDENRPFTELYNVQHMQSNKLDDVSRVCIITIQRLFSMLKGDEQLDPALEEESTFTMAALQREPVPVSYNPRIPIESFDFVITDECHRSIYIQVLDQRFRGFYGGDDLVQFGAAAVEIQFELPRQEALLLRDTSHEHVW